MCRTFIQKGVKIILVSGSSFPFYFYCLGQYVSAKHSVRLLWTICGRDAWNGGIGQGSEGSLQQRKAISFSSGVILSLTLIR